MSIDLDGFVPPPQSPVACPADALAAVEALRADLALARREQRQAERSAVAWRERCEALAQWIDREAMPRYVELLDDAGIEPESSVLVEQARALLAGLKVEGVPDADAA